MHEDDGVDAIEVGIETMDVLGVEVRVDDEAAVKNKVEVDGVVFEVQVTVFGDDP